MYNTGAHTRSSNNGLNGWFSKLWGIVKSVVNTAVPLGGTITHLMELAFEELGIEYKSANLSYQNQIALDSWGENIFSPTLETLLVRLKNADASLSSLQFHNEFNNVLHSLYTLKAYHEAKQESTSNQEKSILEGAKANFIGMVIYGVENAYNNYNQSSTSQYDFIDVNFDPVLTNSVENIFLDWSGISSIVATKVVLHNTQTGGFPNDQEPPKPNNGTFDINNPGGAATPPIIPIDPSGGVIVTPADGVIVVDPNDPFPTTQLPPVSTPPIILINPPNNSDKPTNPNDSFPVETTVVDTPKKDKSMYLKIAAGLGLLYVINKLK